jgi:phosphoribosylaminoimidazole-succinocarboxamide synthase
LHHTIVHGSSKATELVGKYLYDRISQVSLKLYNSAASYARERGLILADTKFEFGLFPSNSPPDSPCASQELILVDEALTPDSSRYWPLSGYTPGQPQPSFDKQYLRDWLVGVGFKKGQEEGPEGNGWEIGEAVVQGTKRRYEDVVEMLGILT